MTERTTREALGNEKATMTKAMNNQIAIKELQAKIDALIPKELLEQLAVCKKLDKNFKEQIALYHEKAEVIRYIHADGHTLESRKWSTWVEPQPHWRENHKVLLNPKPLK